MVHQTERQRLYGHNRNSLHYLKQVYQNLLVLCRDCFLCVCFVEILTGKTICCHTKKKREERIPVNLISPMKNPPHARPQILGCVSLKYTDYRSESRFMDG